MGSHLASPLSMAFITVTVSLNSSTEVHNICPKSISMPMLLSGMGKINTYKGLGGNSFCPDAGQLV